LPAGLSLRWPNDVYASGRKAGGILVEAADGVVVAGLGVNLWWPDPPADRIAVYHHDPGPDAAGHLARSWAESLLERLDRGPHDWGRLEAEAVTLTIGKPVTLADGTEADAVGLDEDGSLIVDDGTRRWTVQSGPVAVDERRVDGR
jgi:BirA family biotin operon repressor/biotin-[acetyl-CoA-carboxylase] ligase